MYLAGYVRSIVKRHLVIPIMYLYSIYNFHNAIFQCNNLVSHAISQSGLAITVLYLMLPAQFTQYFLFSIDAPVTLLPS